MPFSWTIERQVHYPLISEVAVGPDGRVVLVVREPLMTDDRSEFITQLYLGAPGGELRQLTFGEHSAEGPCWSPDGRFIAFRSNRSGRWNLYAMRADGGEAWALTRFEKSDVGELRWSPDGKSLAFLMCEPPSEALEKERKALNDPQRWGVDFEFQHLFVVPFAVGPRSLPEPRQVTRGRYHVVAFEWLAADDASAPAFAVAYRPTPVADDWPQTRLGLVRPGGPEGEPQALGVIADYSPLLFRSPDGRSVACVVGEQPARWAFAGRVVVFPLDGSAPRALADLPDSQPTLLGWSPDGREVYASEWSGVAAQLFALPADGGAPRPIGPAQPINAAAATAGQIAVVTADFHRPNHVVLLAPAGQGAEHAAVAEWQPPLPPDWPQAPLPRAEVLRWRSDDGTEIEGILTYPLEYEEGRRYPLVVSVHGGPMGAFQRGYLGSPEGYCHVAALAERGFLTLRPNPRGSGGYGRAFRFANEGDWGGGDFRDIMAGVDELVARGLADPERLGIMGWSYGGYMTSWAITQTDRFKAACIGAAITNLVSFNGTADIPSFVPDYLGGEYWERLAPYLERSPLFQAERVRTPALIQHGAEDIRVPLGQGRELYNALRRRGVPVELVIYPRQGHSVEEPRLLIDLRRRSVEWLVRWLGASEAEPPRS